MSKTPPLPMSEETRKRLEEVAEKFKDVELFKISNDRARELLKGLRGLEPDSNIASLYESRDYHFLDQALNDELEKRFGPLPMSFKDFSKEAKALIKAWPNV